MARTPTGDVARRFGVPVKTVKTVWGRGQSMEGVKQTSHGPVYTHADGTFLAYVFEADAKEATASAARAVARDAAWAARDAALDAALARAAAFQLMAVARG